MPASVRVPWICGPSASTGGLMPSPFEFKRYGRNGVEVSELLPQLASVIDEMCVIRSMYTFNPTHTPARALFHTGSVLATRPSMGSWITYGLGTENENLPAFVALGEPGGGPQTRSGFLPTEYQGVGFPVNDPDPEKIIPNLRNKNVDANAQRADMDALLALNQNHTKSFGADQFLEGRIKSMETGVSDAVRGDGSLRHPERAAEHPRGVRPRRRSATVVCSRGAWSKPVCGTSTSIIRADRSGTIIGTSTTTCASVVRTWIRRRPRSSAT